MELKLASDSRMTRTFQVVGLQAFFFTLALFPIPASPTMLLRTSVISFLCSIIIIHFLHSLYLGSLWNVIKVRYSIRGYGLVILDTPPLTET